LRRTKIFIFAGPMFGLFGILLSIVFSPHGNPELWIAAATFGLPFVFFAGIIPAALICALDEYLINLTPSWIRAFICGFAGGCSSLALFYFSKVPAIFHALPLLFWIPGALAGFLCSIWSSTHSYNQAAD
jgi:hypothetical protein